MVEKYKYQLDGVRLPHRNKDGAYAEATWPVPGDILKRSGEIENLTTLLMAVDAPLVMTIDAPWGGGKSTFLQLWSYYLETRLGFHSVSMNAWESDYSTDPLVPLVAAFDDWVSSIHEDSVAKKAWQVAKSYAPSLVKSGVVSAVKIVTLNSLDLEKEIEKVVSDSAGKVAGDLVESFRSQKNTLKLFKQRLEDSIALLPSDQSNLLVFVDELDRCRPSYAVELLERIKHLFNIPHVVFVLAVNALELGNCIRGVYGESFDGGGYLKRFVDIDYRLMDRDFSSYVAAQIISRPNAKKLLTAETGFGGGDVLEEVSCTVDYLARRFGLKWREVNSIISRLLLSANMEDGERLCVGPVAVLIFLRDKYSELYKGIVSEDLPSIHDAVKLLTGVDPNREVGVDDMERGSGRVVGLFILAVASGGIHRHIFKGEFLDSWITRQKGLEAHQYSSEEIDLLVYLLKNYIQFSHGFEINFLRRVSERIELVATLNFSGSSAEKA